MGFKCDTYDRVGSIDPHDCAAALHCMQAPRKL